MKTTLDLPEELVREMKIRAARDGRKLRDVATEVIQRGLAQPVSKPAKARKRVEFPLIKCKHPALLGQELTPERIHEILLNQEIEWHHETSGR
jgi:plasmid stability protein